MDNQIKNEANFRYVDVNRCATCKWFKRFDSMGRNEPICEHEKVSQLNPNVREDTVCNFWETGGIKSDLLAWLSHR